MNALFTFMVIVLTGIGIRAQKLPFQVPATVAKTCSDTPQKPEVGEADLMKIESSLYDQYGPPCKCANQHSWKRIAFVDMTDSSHQCPPNWTPITTPVRACGRSSGQPGCESAIFATKGFTYNRVCGRVNGYQKGTTDAFNRYNIDSSYTLEQAYVDGVSVTHGPAGSRQHIWTFAAALYEDFIPGQIGFTTYVPTFNCECTNTYYNWPHTTPPYVGNDYFCETGRSDPGLDFAAFYPSDKLWDGYQCGGNSTCCQFNRPPWFCASLPSPTTDDLELRICNDHPSNDENVFVSLVELYVAMKD